MTVSMSRDSGPSGGSSRKPLRLRLDQNQLFSVLVMVEASRKELHQLHTTQLPALGVKSKQVLEPLADAEERIAEAHAILLETARRMFPNMDLPDMNTE